MGGVVSLVQMGWPLGPISEQSRRWNVRVDDVVEYNEKAWMTWTESDRTADAVLNSNGQLTEKATSWA
ncbi:hypothetical protein SynMITS9220_00744 [Synechococcus sp. MIT S9220]|nr:hypothetical protein SynMITS9220_00744 [Synechococcus sp. MIT S9220]